MGLALVGLGGDGFCAAGWLELLDSGFDKARCDLATTGLFNGAFPGLLRLFGSQADQRPHLPFMFGFGVVTNGVPNG